MVANGLANELRRRMAIQAARDRAEVRFNSLEADFQHNRHFFAALAFSQQNNLSLARGEPLGGGTDEQSTKRYYRSDVQAGPAFENRTDGGPEAVSFISIGIAARQLLMVRLNMRRSDFNGSTKTATLPCELSLCPYYSY